jgi:23S rRNA U2552 (ribose-2'-O)-methylase RlmE/FtsJ
MYILPNILYNINISNLFFFINNNNNKEIIINNTLNNYINNILENIIIKKFNPYHIPNSSFYNKNNNYLDYYYQMIEIIKINNINNILNKEINIYHINNELNNKGYQDCINNYNSNCKQNHSFYINENNFYFNLKYIIEYIKYDENKNNSHLVIANHFNEVNKNTKYNNNMLCQLILSLTKQIYDGTLIFKIYNLYDVLNCEIVYLLSMVYTEVSLFKPTSECYINGEIFIICKFFKLHNANNIVNNIISMMNDNKNIIKIFNFNIPNLFLKKIEEYNAIFGQNRIEILNQCLIEKNYNKQEQIKLNYLKKMASFCNSLNIKYLI